ncbi:F-box domain-containing protein [Colletotrichum plurivorum]|uniref:F-box domain-containing protein n=1 Tax=Colletotrichum plurivorum TaxID=2175906 RepID=A0A8H6NN19_9PEZI|nr:F-box domain-containing protein [Colletotrichum plurivorum]
MTMAPRRARAGRGKSSANRRCDPSVPSPSAKIQLINLPRELLSEIFHLCKSPVQWHRSNTLYYPLKLSSVSKYMRAIGIRIIFKNMRRSLNLCIKGRAPFGSPDASYDRRTPAILAQVLCKMNNLELLAIETSYANQSFVIPFRKHLRYKGITLPSVNALTYHTSTTVDFLPDVFANLQVLCLNVGKSLKKTRGLDAVTSHLSLHTLELYREEGWVKEGVEEIFEFFPSVATLLVDGGLKSTRPSSLIPVFQKFVNLVDLTLATKQAGSVICPYTIGREPRPPNEDSQVNAVALFQSCRHLKKLLLDNGFRRETFGPKRQGDEVTGLAVETDNYNMW